MEKRKSQKLLTWEKKDYTLNTVVYLVNFILLTLTFLAVVYIRSGMTAQGFRAFFADISFFMNFIFLLGICVLTLLAYLLFEAKDFLKNAGNSEMLFLIIELSIIICFVSEKYLNLYFRPFALPILLTLFLTDTRKAIFMDFLFCVIYFLFDAFSGFASPIQDTIAYSAFFFATNLATGFIAIYLMRNVYSRFKLIALSLFISIPAVCGALFPYENFGSSGLLRSLLYAAFSGTFAVTVCFVLLPFMEIVFKKVTCFKYAELTDHKSKLIKKMIDLAPGTFNHSMLVSSIAESCATAIGEDALLARTCVYYHDIGKIRRPEMFKENQGEGGNPNDELAPELSASIIKAHTRDGYKLMKKNNIPQIVADVALQHHGTMPILYFYNKAKKFTDGTVDIANFCYDGPKPQSKIAAIIMIADSSEAATRVLKDRSRENVLKTVRKIVDQRLDLGQFDECEITLKELEIITNTTVNCLTGIYHKRVEYPKINIKELESELEKDE